MVSANVAVVSGAMVAPGCVEPEVAWEKTSPSNSTASSTSPRAQRGDRCFDLAPPGGEAPDAEVAREQAAAPEPAAAPKRAFSVSNAVRIGSVALGCTAGAVNAIALKAIGSFVSHHTGSFARVGLGDEDVAVNGLLLVFSFVCGALLCGVIVALSQSLLRAKVPFYDVCLILEAAFLVATTFLAEHTVARYLAAAACGLQNAMATHWGGAVSRTTHMTGLFTDVGLLFGRLLSVLLGTCCGKEIDAKERTAAADDLSKLSHLGGIAATYLLGILLGSLCYDAIGNLAFLLPAGAVGCVGCAYFSYRVFRRLRPASAELQVERSGDAVAEPVRAVAPSFSPVLPVRLAPAAAR